MKDLEVYCTRAVEMGMSGAKVIDPRTVVTAEWVRMKCQYGCPRFGKSLCCPPHTPTPEITRRVIDSYEKAILVHQKMERGGRGKGFGRDFSETVARLEIEMFKDGYYKAWSMGAGPCRLCKECDPEGLCRNGMLARPSLEACGVDVFKTARDNGFRIEVVLTHDEERNNYGVILV